MSELSPANIAARIEANLAVYSLLAGNSPHGTRYDAQEVKWAYTGTAAMNRVVSARFEPDRAAAAIGQIVARFNQQPFTWITGPADKPDNLTELLLEQGFKHLMPWMGMAYDLSGPLPKAQSVDGFVIVEAECRETIRLWAETAGAGFNMHPAIRRDFPMVLPELPQENMLYLLGYLHGIPVATASAFFGEDAGAYFISSWPAARGKGLATLMTLALMTAAKSRGHRLMVLEASQAGYIVYKRLGFKHYLDMNVYGLHYA